jgi:uncharacterized membrane protein
MRNKLLFVLSLALLAACSAPKYTYNFDHYNYNAGKKKSTVAKEVVAMQGPEVIQANELVASAEALTVVPEKTEVKSEVRKTYVQMTKSERKDLRIQLKSEIKKHIKEKKDAKHATAIGDRDLKLAAIFGAVGIVGLIIGGDVFYIIGAIALIIGVVFFVKWLVRQ